MPPKLKKPTITNSKVYSQNVNLSKKLVKLALQLMYTKQCSVLDYFMQTIAAAAV